MSQRHDPSLEPAASSDGRFYWRSMEQLAQTDEFKDLLSREFPAGADLPPTDVSRRGFLGVVAAAVALASTTACRKPERTILPFSDRPEDRVPGIPVFYATTLATGAYGTGVLVRSSDGRPTKVEGNPLHPASLRGTSIYLQGDLLTVYDPGRSKTVWNKGKTVLPEPPAAETEGEGNEPPRDPDAAWNLFASAWKRLAGTLGDGEKLALLLAPSASPTLAHMVEQVRQQYPAAKIHWWEPVNEDHELAGSQLAFGKALTPQYDFTAADRVVALDSDFLTAGANAVRWAHDFAQRRRPYGEGGADRLNRLYAIEPEFTVTGSQADHRFAVRAHDIADVAKALAAAVGVQGVRAGGEAPEWLGAVAEDLSQHRGKSLVIAGPRQPAAVHALVHAINAALGNVGATVRYTATPDLLAESRVESIRALAQAIDQGQVDTLLCLGTNPVYDAPADLDFAGKLEKVQNTVHLGLYRDETGVLSTWHLNAAHQLESWGDTRSYDGTVSIQQPLILPLYAGRSAIEVLALVADYDVADGYDIVRYYWEDNARVEDIDAWWKRALRDGLVADSAFAAVEAPAPRTDAIGKALAALPAAAAGGTGNLELAFRQDATVYDGRWANNAWLQECPDPVSKLSWDNAALMSPRTADALGVGNRDLIELQEGGRKLEIAVWQVPGMADWTIGLPLGHGRGLLGGHPVMHVTGFDTYRLRTSDHLGMVGGAKATKLGRQYKLVTTQDHGAMEGRDLYRRASAAVYREEPQFAPSMSPAAKEAEVQTEEHPEHPVTEPDLLKALWKERKYDEGYQWGMVIDLNTCTGCSACVVACQAENNIPSVGKEQVSKGREMHWIRIDRYYTAEGDGRPEVDGKEPGEKAEAAWNENGLPKVAKPGMVHQPVPCMQCETAPCESVCPVGATTHSPEGLNDMAYNRCIGTRYCSNNCPYKVRRFNWFLFTEPVENSPTLQMVQNPDVTVRNRGVMEKCTYCVQRINGAKIDAKVQGRPLVDGEFTTACAQACPTHAITFGNIADQSSSVAKLRGHDLNYAMLSERALKPRTTYLARVTNPNPKLS